MNKTDDALYSLWLGANEAKIKFYNEHLNAWNSEVNETYRVLDNEATKRFHEWKAARTGKSVEQVAYEENEVMHSRFD